MRSKSRPAAADGDDGRKGLERTAARLILQLRSSVGQGDPWPLYDRSRATGYLIPAAWDGLLVLAYELCDEVLRAPGVWEVPDRDWRERQGGVR